MKPCGSGFSRDGLITPRTHTRQTNPTPQILVAMSLESTRAALAKHPYLRLAIVFGSVARGGARRDSDVDVAVQADHALTADQKQGLIEDIGLATGRPVDLVDLKTAGIPLLGEILRHGIRLFGNDDDYARAALRNIGLNEDLGPAVQAVLDERNRQWLR